MNTSAMKDVRYLYLRDAASNRVITVARQLSDDKNSVVFALSVNRPSFKNVSPRVRPRSGDQFKKSVGRELALGRLVGGKNFTVELRRNLRPIEAILEFLAYGNAGVPRCVEKVAREEYRAAMLAAHGYLGQDDAEVLAD